VLVYPAVVARLDAVIADAVEARARILVELPALGAVIAGGLRPVERALAQAAVEAADVAAREGDPHHALRIDVAAAHAEARHRHVVDLGERRLRRIGAGSKPHDRTGVGADGAPDRAVDRVRHHRVEHLANAPILARIEWLVRLGVFAALA